MIPHPAALDAALGAVAWRPWCSATLVNPDGSALTGDVAEGRVTHDDTSWPRTRATLVIPTSLTPGETTSPVSPWGGRVLIHAGAYIGSQLYVFQAATLAVDDVAISRPAGTVEVSAVSWEARVNEDRYAGAGDTYNAAGSVSQVVTDLVRRTLGASWPVSVSLSSNPTVAAGTFQLDGDLWAVVDDIMDTAGGEAYFAADGTLVLRDVPTLKATPDIALSVGAGGTVLSYRSQRRWAYNRVAVRFDDGDDATTNVVGVWEDTASGSATRVTGPYGRHTRVDTVSCDVLPSQAVADAAAAALARRAAAAYRVVTMETVPAPWLLPGDTARVTMLGGLTEDHLVSRVEWPLSGLEPMTVTTTDDSYTTP